MGRETDLDLSVEGIKAQDPEEAGNCQESAENGAVNEDWRVFECDSDCLADLAEANFQSPEEK